MIIGLRKISEEEMLRNWALAEVVSIRRQKYLHGILPEGLIQKISGEQSEFTEDEYKHLTKMIRSTRAELLNGLLELDLVWHEGRLPIEELKELEMMSWPPFINLAGSKRFLDLVNAFQKGRMPPNHHEFAENLGRIRKEFKMENMKGRPIMLSRNTKPPYILVEGFTRLSAMLLNILDGKSYEEEIPIILGVGKRLSEWQYA